MASDNEQQPQDDQHSIWNGRLKTNPKEGKFFLEFVDALGARFDGMPTDDILQTFWGESRETLEKLIKKANKREKKVEATFKPKDIKKAPTANILFQKDFKERCDKNNVKFSLKASADAYKALSDKERAKYVKESQRLKEEYQAEFDRQRAQAIQTGEFPEDKPKRPITAYFRYLQVVRPQLQNKYKNDEDRKEVNSKIAKDSAEMWKALSDKEKKPYEDAYLREKEAFEEAMKKWEANETQRRKNNTTGSKDAKASAEVKIETTGTKKTASKPAAAAAAPASTATSDSEAEVEVPKPVRGGKKAVAVPAKAQSDSEAEPPQEADEEEVSVAPAKATKAKAAAKPKTK